MRMLTSSISVGPLPSRARSAARLPSAAEQVVQAREAAEVLHEDVAEVDQRPVGRRVGLAQPLEHRARWVGAAFGEELRADHLKQIAEMELETKRFPSAS